MDACLVTVKDNRYIIGHTVNQANLFVGQCRSAGCHHIFHTLLVHRHHISIAFHQIAEVLLADGFLGLEETEEFAPFAVDKAFGRVHVFHVYALGGCIQHTTTKTCHSAAHGKDRPDNPAAESVAQLPVLLVLQAEACS